MSGSRVELDTSQLVRAMRQLDRGLTRSVPTAAQRTASTVASDLRSHLPVRTGRLRGSVGTDRTPDGAQVSYGSGVPYARYIDGRTGAVDAAASGAQRQYRLACEAVARMEVSRL